MIVIYGLYDPRVRPIEWRYVGKTKYSLETRLHEHLTCVDDLSTYFRNWVVSLLRAGAKPAIKALEEVPDGGNWGEVEKKWIMIFRLMGYRLTNLAEGGMGSVGCKKPAVSEANRRRVCKSSTRAKHVRNWTGDRNPMKNPIVVEKIADGNRRRGQPWMLGNTFGRACRGRKQGLEERSMRSRAALEKWAQRRAQGVVITWKHS